MNNLPGGLYACCINTLLDETESAIVRENAAFVFATLISYRNTSNELDETLYPKSANGMTCDWIGHLLHHHDLIRQIVTSVRYLHVEQLLDTEQIANNSKIVSCNLMRSYCIVLINILPLKGAGDINPIFNAMTEISRYIPIVKLLRHMCKIYIHFHHIYRAIPKIRQSINKSSILLLSEICELIWQCFTRKLSLIEVILREFHVVQCFISFLNVDLLGKIITNRSKSLSISFNVKMFNINV